MIKVIKRYFERKRRRREREIEKTQRELEGLYKRLDDINKRDLGDSEGFVTVEKAVISIRIEQLEREMEEF